MEIMVMEERSSVYKMEAICESLSGQAQTAYDDSHYGKASKLFTELLEKDLQTPKGSGDEDKNWLRAQMLANIALCQIKEGREKDAADTASRCSGLQPRWFKGPYLMSMCSEVAGDHRGAAKQVLEALVKAHSYLRGSSAVEAVEYLMGMLLRLAYTADTLPELHAGLEHLSWQWQDLFVQLTRLEDWAAVDALLSSLDRHQLQEAVLCGPSHAPTPRDNLAQIGHRALDTALKHAIDTGKAMRLHTMLRRFQAALDFATQVHDKDGNSPLHLVAKQEDCGATDRAYLIQLLLSHGFSADNRNWEGKEARDYLQEGSLSHRLLAWLSDKDRALILDLASMQDDEVKNFLHTIICSHGNLSLPDILPVIPCLTMEEREAVVKVLNNHGNNSAWQQLLRILHNGEEFGLVQLSIAVFKYDINLAKQINRVYQRLSLRGVYSDGPVYRAVRRHWSEMVWALSQTFTSTCQHHFVDRSQLHRWFKQVLKAEGCFTAALVMLQYIGRWQGAGSFLDLIDRLASEGYEDMRQTVLDSLAILEDEDKEAPTLRFKILQTPPWPELEELEFDGPSDVPELLPQSPSSPPNKNQHRRPRRRKHSARKSSKEAVQQEPLRDYETEIINQVSMNSNQLIFMPQTSSHIAIATGIIKRHLLEMKEGTDTEDGETAINANGCDIDVESLKELDSLTGSASPENSPRSPTSRVLLVVSSKKDVAMKTTEVKKYMPFHKVVEHGIHSGQKMGLMRAVQCNTVVVCSADSLHHALHARAFSLQELSLLLLPLPSSPSWAASNYYTSIFRQVAKLSSPRSKASDTASESASSDSTFSPQVVVMVTTVSDMEVDSSEVVSVESQMDKILRIGGLDGVICAKDTRESLLKEMRSNLVYKWRLTDDSEVDLMQMEDCFKKEALNSFGTYGNLFGLVLCHQEFLAHMSSDKICESLGLLLPGNLYSQHINSCCEIRNISASGKSILYFLSMENDEQMVLKIKEEDTLKGINFVLIVTRDGEWHILHGHHGLWQAAYGVAFEVFVRSYINSSK